MSGGVCVCVCVCVFGEEGEGIWVGRMCFCKSW